MPVDDGMDSRGMFGGAGSLRSADGSGHGSARRPGWGADRSDADDGDTGGIQGRWRGGTGVRSRFRCGCGNGPGAGRGGRRGAGSQPAADQRARMGSSRYEPAVAFVPAPAVPVEPAVPDEYAGLIGRAVLAGRGRGAGSRGVRSGTGPAADSLADFEGAQSADPQTLACSFPAGAGLGIAQGRRIRHRGASRRRQARPNPAPCRRARGTAVRVMEKENA